MAPLKCATQLRWETDVRWRCSLQSIKYSVKDNINKMHFVFEEVEAQGRQRYFCTNFPSCSYRTVWHHACKQLVDTFRISASERARNNANSFKSSLATKSRNAFSVIFHTSLGFKPLFVRISRVPDQPEVVK